MKEKLLALLKSLGMDPGDKKADLEKALEQLESAPAQPPTPASATTDPGLAAELAAVKQQLKDVIGALTEEKDQRVAAQKTIAERMKADQGKRVDAVLEKHEKAGQIIPAMKEHFKKLLDTDFDTAVKIIEVLPVDPAAKKAAEATADGKGKPPEGKKDEGSRIRTLEQLAPASILEGIQKLSTSTN